MSILVTGAAGFIGYHVSNALLARGESVIGFDNMNSYYDPRLKDARLTRLSAQPGFSFVKADLCDTGALSSAMDGSVDRVIHLAAQAGVRHSLTNPYIYQQSNNEGYLNLLEAVRAHQIKNLVCASTSSVYGSNTKFPFSESDPTDTPVSLYAATKKANEVTAHAYSHLFGIPCSMLRFFTVYGPWGRPDMALFIFTKAILEGRTIDVYNHGKMKRNFTFVDDIVQGVLLALDNPRPYEIYNLASSETVELLEFIKEIEHNLGKKASMNLMPLQPGDVVHTEADIAKIGRLGYAPKVSVSEGVKRFVAWYQEHYV
jgi:UDP-glucuronate 4-epimerase